MRLCSIASGSSGNCIYVGSEATHLLVDVGISGKRTESGLRELGLAMGDIDGILVTLLKYYLLLLKFHLSDKNTIYLHMNNPYQL